jgi:hypothetical protein
MDRCGGAGSSFVSVRYGRLGGYALDSSRFQAPELRRIPEEPLVSCLCVTENRHAFMPWLLWSYDRQAWRRRELVIVDSSEPAISLPNRSDVRVLHAPLGSSLGKKRNLALEAARGQVIAWFDDDDWQHPQRLSRLVPALRESARQLGASFIGPSQSYFIDLSASRAELYRAPRYAIFNGAVFYTHMVRHAGFAEDVIRTEDTRWIHRLLLTRQGAALEADHPSLFLWLSHDVNITNRTQNRRLDRPASAIIAELGGAWADTPAQLRALRERLLQQPSSPPVRLALAQGNVLGRCSPARKLSGAAHPPPALRAPRALPRSATGLKLALYWHAGTGDRAAGDSAARDSAARDPRQLAANAGGDLYCAQLAIAARHRLEWQPADYVGVLSATSPGIGWDTLANAIDADERRADVYALGGCERTTLAARHAPAPALAALARYLLLQGLGLRESVWQRQLLLPSRGWVARPRVFSEYALSWLARGRAALLQRHDAQLRRLLEDASVPAGPAAAPPQAASDAVLALLAPLAFALGGHRVGTACSVTGARPGEPRSPLP